MRHESTEIHFGIKQIEILHSKKTDSRRCIETNQTLPYDYRKFRKIDFPPSTFSILMGKNACLPFKLKKLEKMNFL